LVFINRAARYVDEELEGTCDQGATELNDGTQVVYPAWRNREIE
jgi:hypothetical protein